MIYGKESLMNKFYKLFFLALALILLAACALAEETVAEVPAEAPAPVSVALDRTGTVKLPLGDTLTLTPALTPSDAATTFSWKSSKKSVAAVSGGVVTAKKAGTATITVTTANKKKASVRIRVYDP